MQSQTIVGAFVKIYIGGVLYPEAQAVSWAIDYGEEAIYGVDSALPQEIRQTRISVQGQVNGIRLKLSGGIQSRNARTILRESLEAPYVSLRIVDRSTDEILLFVPQAKITNQSQSVSAKSVLQLSFGFKGITPLETNDIS
jgi:hypothetical protein